MDQELISYLDKRFDAIETDIRELKTDVRALKTDVSELKTEVKQLKKETYETRILVEHLQDKVQLVAEGLAGVVESFKTHRTEVSEEIKGIRGLVQQAYSSLDHRVRSLEGRSTDH